MNTNPFPRCDLHQRPLVDDLPGRCPLRHEDPMWAAFNMRDAAETRLGDVLPALHIDVVRADTCCRCVSKLIGNSHVKRLRAELLAAEAKGNRRARTDIVQNSGQGSIKADKAPAELTGPSPAPAGCTIKELANAR